MRKLRSLANVSRQAGAFNERKQISKWFSSIGSITLVLSALAPAQAQHWSHRAWVIHNAEMKAANEKLGMLEEVTQQVQENKIDQSCYDLLNLSAQSHLQAAQYAKHLATFSPQIQEDENPWNTLGELSKGAAELFDAYQLHLASRIC